MEFVHAGLFIQAVLKLLYLHKIYSISRLPFVLEIASNT